MDEELALMAGGIFWVLMLQVVIGVAIGWLVLT